MIDKSLSASLALELLGKHGYLCDSKSRAIGRKVVPTLIEERV